MKKKNIKKEAATKQSSKKGNEKEAATKQSNKKGKEKKTANKFQKVGFNILFGGIAFLLIFACYKKDPGYKWVYENLLRENYRIALENDSMTVDERRAYKLGFSFSYLKYICDNTSDSAVILMPERGVYFPENEKSDFGGDMGNKLWRLRVLYPRKVVDADDVGNKYADSITHVAVVNGWGYDKVDYRVANEPKHGLLPITYK